MLLLIEWDLEWSDIRDLTTLCFKLITPTKDKHTLMICRANIWGLSLEATIANTTSLSANLLKFTWKAEATWI